MRKILCQKYLSKMKVDNKITAQKVLEQFVGRMRLANENDPFFNWAPVTDLSDVVEALVFLISLKRDK